MTHPEQMMAFTLIKENIYLNKNRYLIACYSVFAVLLFYRIPKNFTMKLFRFLTIQKPQTKKDSIAKLNIKLNTKFNEQFKPHICLCHDCLSEDIYNGLKSNNLGSSIIYFPKKEIKTTTDLENVLTELKQLKAYQKYDFGSKEYTYGRCIKRRIHYCLECSLNHIFQDTNILNFKKPRMAPTFLMSRETGIPIQFCIIKDRIFNWECVNHYDLETFANVLNI